MPLGLYLSVPFCRSKCSYCNFASDVFSRSQFSSYVERTADDLAHAADFAFHHGANLEKQVDSVYLGGGTPTILAPEDLLRLFAAARASFDFTSDAEITVECAPGTLSDAMLDTLLACGVNRVSLGVQSFVDQEAAAVGRLHTREKTLVDIARLRAAGIHNLSLDLIAGLPHQTAESWQYSLDQVIATGVPHASIYILEVDEDSRLGRELIAGGTRYHAHFVPDDEATADYYEEACHRYSAAGVAQYEISNFARQGFESRHNLKYWTRQPYFGVGVDAHSMLRAAARDDSQFESVRLAMPDTLEGFLADGLLMPRTVTRTNVSVTDALEECFFLGLRLNRGVNLDELRAQFGEPRLAVHLPAIAQCLAEGLLEDGADETRDDTSSIIRLTPRGRLLSNNVFARFLLDTPRILAKPAVAVAVE